MSKSSLVIGLSVVGVIGVAVGLSVMLAKFARTELQTHAAESARPRVTNTRPAANESNVALVTGVVAEITIPTTGAGVNPKTLDAGVELVRTRDGRIIPAQRNTTGSGDAVILKPIDLLEPDTEYVFRVTPELKDTSGAAFCAYTMAFRTAKDFKLASFPAAFDKVEMSGMTLEQNAFTSLAIGPDGMLYAGTFAGIIYRYTIESDGTLTPGQPAMEVIVNNNGPRLITGIAFDPDSTPDFPILWVNHGQMAVTPEGKLEGADDWTGKLSRLARWHYQDILIGLPRAYKDHLNFQMTFGPDGAMFFTQGSHTSVGDVDKKWAYRPERKLSAAVLRVDPSIIKSPPLNPVNVQTDEDGAYEPSAPGAALTLYATGVRSGFDLLFHRNGRLYTGVNGAAGNEGNTPASPDRKTPALRDVKETTDDVLLKIEKGKYYGHPNPTRGEYALNGANPTQGVDVMEVREYPVGTKPDPNYAEPAYVFGKNFSPNGLIEFKGKQFGGALDGYILVTRYSDGKDVLVLKLNEQGDVTETIAGIDGLTGFTDPLDILQDPKTGNLYVAEYGGRKITLLRPREGQPSTRAQRTIIKQ